MRRSLAIAIVLAPAASLAQSNFVNFETPHVAPIAMTPSGDTLLVVNTADNRLEVFDISSGAPAYLMSIPVGLDPVSVRARTDGEAWVVNHVSDSISIVDLAAGAVVRTLPTADEPTDVVFAGAAGRAFVSCSQANQVMVFDPADLTQPPITLAIDGEEPRALAVSPDGSTVYAAIFESGNNTTVIDEDTVSDPTGPHGGVNPPPNTPLGFDPPLNPDNPPAPIQALILKKDTATGDWFDDSGAVWPQALVPWGLHDHDLVVIDADTLAIGYVSGLMNINMALGALPDGRVAVVGTDAINHVRFEPNVTGRLTHSIIAIVDPADPGQSAVLDLNPHLADEYAAGVSTIPEPQRADSIADPRGVAWRSDGVGYVTGMGSDNVAILDSGANRLGRIEVAAGPTGLALDEPRGRLYVVSKFDAAVSTIDTVSNTVVAEVGFYDPTPDDIRAGRPFLYDARRTSGLGVTACAACHVDARMDQLAWDLGDPSGEVQPFDQTCQVPLGGLCEDFHPLKGPMMTQTLQGIIGTEPLHWRGDRNDLAAFNPAFVGLLGDDAPLTADEMQAFEGFVATIAFNPNPNRPIDDSLPASIEGGSPATGRNLFRTGRLDGNVLNCSDCHVIASGGTNGQITPGVAMGTPQSMKIAQLRNLTEKRGFSTQTTSGSRGFGFVHNGTVPTLMDFLRIPVFSFNNDQQRRDVRAFLLVFNNGTHAGVGQQVTLDGSNNADPGVVARLDLMVAQADLAQVGLVAKGRQAGLARGYAYAGAGQYQSDRAAEAIDDASLRAAATADAELTFTMVPLGSETRIGVDRDEDGYFDRDELDHCGDPADPTVIPADLDGDAAVSLADLAQLLANFGQAGGMEFEDGDLDGDGDVDISDLALLLSNFGRICT